MTGEGIHHVSYGSAVLLLLGLLFGDGGKGYLDKYHSP